MSVLLYNKRCAIERMKMKTTLALLWLSLLFLTTNLSVNAQPVNTSLTLAVLSPPTEKECTIAATLEDENGNPLQNMDIDFYICGTDKIGSNKTDSAGVASLKLTDNPPYVYYPRLDPFETKVTETWKINAVFSGTTSHAQSSSEDVYIAFVLTNYTPYLVVGGIIALVIIAAAGYIIFRRRKNATPILKTTKEA